jgi:DinB superfamily
MASLDATISAGFADYYRRLAQQLHKWVDPLTTEQIWRRPYPYGNSVGHLLLHLIGNLNYYIGAQIANTGYVRNRDLEFTDTKPKAKDELLRNFDATVAMVISTVREQGPADWPAPYSAERSDAKDRFMMVLQGAGHLYHHVGQIIYLSKEIARQDGAARTESLTHAT